MKYSHKEAFALMWYACTCGHRERYWNSRDGVTPFGTSCPSCGEQDMKHILWGADLCVPNHKPHFGQRIWIDLTRERAEEIAVFRADSAIKAGFYNPADREQLIKDIIDGIFVHGTAPDMRIHGYVASPKEI